MPPAVKFPCIECKKACSSKSVSCCVCKRWVHGDCIGLETYNLVTAMFERENYHVWSCSGCTAAYKQLSDACAANTKSITTMQKSIEDLTKLIEKANESVRGVDEKFEQQKLEIENIKKDRENTIEMAESNVYTEMSEREARKSNLVVYGIPEADSNLSNNDKKEQDITEFLEVLNEIGCATNVKEEIKIAVRLGQKREDNSDRPLLIGLKKENVKDQILDNAWRLKDSTYDDVSISPDLTKKQRSEERKLKEKADELNSKLDEETAKKWIWKTVGQRGKKRLLQVQVREPSQHATRGRGRGRGTTRGTTRGATRGTGAIRGGSVLAKRKEQESH